MSIFRAFLFAVVAFINIACHTSYCSQSARDPIYDATKPGLYIYAFNTGQANCIVMRHGKSSYIVDAGSQGVPKDFNTNLRNMLTGSTLKYVFITHPHTDHYNLLNAVLETFNSAQNQHATFYLGGLQKHYPQDLSINQSNTVYVPPRQEVQRFVDGNLSFTIIPSSVQARENDKNTYSYMLLVSYNGKNILFGGDYILKKDIVSSLDLPKLDIVFLPHHGSVRTSSDVLVDDDEGQCEISDGDSITEFTKATIPSLYFICGGYNTNVHNTQCFYNLEHLRNTVTPHDISLNSSTTGKVHTQDDNQTTRPLFATQNALLGFYGIRIKQRDGFIEMYGVNSEAAWKIPFEQGSKSRLTLVNPQCN